MRQEGKFILFNTIEFGSWLERFPASRVVRLIQNHHTWIPSYEHFDRNPNHFEHLKSMEDAHLQRGFSEIAQNLTTFPDGMVATCRSIDKIPAGIKGANKNGICIEHLGCFDAGHDRMSAEHEKCIIDVNALLCDRFGLTPNTNTVVYHHWYDLVTGERKDGAGTTKSCPGTAFFSGNKPDAAENEFIPKIKQSLASPGPAKPPASPQALYSAQVTANALNVRTLPTVSATIVKTLTRGTDIQVHEERAGWCRIHPTESYWVNSVFLQTTGGPIPSVRKLYGAEVTADALNVRSFPSMSGTIVKALTRGTDVHVFEERAGWCKIHPAESYWVYSRYLQVGP